MTEDKGLHIAPTMHGDTLKVSIDGQICARLDLPATKPTGAFAARFRRGTVNGSRSTPNHIAMWRGRRYRGVFTGTGEARLAARAGRGAGKGRF